MKVSIEVARDGVTPLRYFHRGGTEDRYAWTAKYTKDHKKKCPACSNGTLGEEVTSGRQRSE
jgi:hypothetical protein